MKTEPKGVIEWLLETSQPAVRYRALLDLLGRREGSDEVRAARQEIPEKGWVKEILSRQAADGTWEWDARRSLYVPKYIASIWNIIMLADLGMTSDDKRVRKTCELFLNEYSRDDGGFDSPGREPRRSELCVTGNLARTLALCGYTEDPRVKTAFEWLVRNQMEDGGWHCFYEKAFGKGTLDCWEGLAAFAALPRSSWTRGIKRSVERGAEFYLRKALFHQGRRRYLPWFRFHYPVHYYYDILVGLDVLTKLGYGDDERLDPALEIMTKKRRSDGTWALDAVHPDIGAGAGYRLNMRKVTPFSLETEGEPSKWTTLTCLRVLKRVEDSR